jgi:hypothetical protein
MIKTYEEHIPEEAQAATKHPGMGAMPGEISIGPYTVVIFSQDG